MATDKELAGQLDVQNQINAVLAQRAALLQRQTSQIEGQVRLAAELCRAMNCEGLEGMEDRLGEIKDGMAKAADEAERMPATVADIEKNLKGAGKQASMSAKAMKAFSVAGLAVKSVGLAIFDGLKSIGNMVASVAGLYSKAMGFMAKTAGEAASRGRAVAEAVEEMREQFGDLSVGVGKEATDAMGAFDKAAADAGVSTGRFFGDFEEGRIAKIKAMSEAIAGFGTLASGPLKGQLAEAALSFTVLQKGAGLSNEAFESLGNRALTAGKSIGGVLDDTVKSIASVAKAMGVSTKTMGKQFNEVAKDVSNFGHLSVKEMTTLSAVMIKTGISMSTVVGVAKQFDQFDKGAESVAKLTQAFGMQLNAVDLLNASDEERMQMLKSSFQATGKSIEDLSRQERQYLAASAGIAEGDLERVFGDQAGAIDETATAAEKAQQAQMDSADALKEMAKSIRSIFAPVQTFMGFFDSFFKGFKRGFTTNNSFLKKFQAALTKVFKIGEELGAWLNKFLGESKSAKTAFDKIFDLEGQISFFQLISDSLKGLLTGEKTLTQVFESFVEHFKPKLKAVWEGLKSVFAYIGEFLSSPEVVAALSEGASKLIGMIKRVFENPKVQQALATIGAVIVGYMLGKAIINGLTSALGKGVVKGLASIMGGGGGSPASLSQGIGGFRGIMDAVNEIKWKTIPKVIAILGALGLLVAIGIVPFAYLLEAAGNAVTPAGLLKGIGVLFAMVGALTGMAILFAVAAGIAMLASGPQVLFALAGIAGAMLLLPVIGAFGVILISLLGMVPIEKTMKAVALFGGIATIFIALAALFVAAAVIGGAAVLGGAFLVNKGMNAIEGIADRIMKFVPPIMQKLFESTSQWSADEVDKRIGTVIGLIDALANFAGKFGDIIGQVAGMNLEGAEATEAFKQIGLLFEKLGNTMDKSITKVKELAQGITADQIPSLEIMATLLNSLGGVMGGLGTAMGAFKTSITEVGYEAGLTGVSASYTDKEVFPEIETIAGMVTGMLDPMIEILFGDGRHYGLIQKLAGIDLTGDELTKVDRIVQIMEGLSNSMTKLGGVGEKGSREANYVLAHLENNVGFMIQNVENIHGRLQRGNRRTRHVGGLANVARLVAEDTDLIATELNNLGNSINLKATIDKINTGLSVGSSKIRLEAQKVTLNVALEVKLDANKLAEGLSKENVVDNQFVLKRANPA